jgi:hypothetical protein
MNYVIVFTDVISRTTLLGDIRRIIYPPSIFNRVVYDFDDNVKGSTATSTIQLSNDDEQRYPYIVPLIT